MWIRYYIHISYSLIYVRNNKQRKTLNLVSYNEKKKNFLVKAWASRIGSLFNIPKSSMKNENTAITYISYYQED